jgi:hypothetical protein
MSAGNPEAQKTSKISIALSEESSRPNQATMANSDFWRGLTDQFLAVRVRLLAGEFTDYIYKEFEVLAGRGARELFSASESESVPNLLAVWLDASKEERLASQFSSQSNEVWTEENYAPKLTMGTLDRLCKASIIFCKELENKALQAEFEEELAQKRKTIHAKMRVRPSSGPVKPTTDGATRSKKSRGGTSRPPLPVAMTAATFPAASQNAQNGGLARRSPAFVKDDNEAASVAVDRAMFVEKIRREIVEISGKLELLEDYDVRVRNVSAFEGYITVGVCNRHLDLRDKLCAIKTTNKPSIIALACEIASRHADKPKALLPRTFHDAQKRYGAEARLRLDQRQ